MAVKRISSLHNERQRTCLHCGVDIPKEMLIDNKMFVCPCGQAHFVDILGQTLFLTVKERPELRHRRFINNTDVRYTHSIEKQLRDAKKEVASWKAAAEELAELVAMAIGNA